MTAVPSVFSVGWVQLRVTPDGEDELLLEELEELEELEAEDDEDEDEDELEAEDELEDEALDEDELDEDPVEGGLTELPLPPAPAPALDELSFPPPQAVSTIATPSAAINALMDA